MIIRKIFLKITNFVNSNTSKPHFTKFCFTLILASNIYKINYQTEYLLHNQSTFILLLKFYLKSIYYIAQYNKAQTPLNHRLIPTTIGHRASFSIPSIHDQLISKECAHTT